MNIFSFEGRVSTTLPLQHESIIDNTSVNECGRVPIKLLSKQGSGPDLVCIR